MERGLFWSLLLLALALRFPSDPGFVALCLTGASFALGLSVMEISYAMAYKDDLTGLPARRALMRDLRGYVGDTTPSPWWMWTTSRSSMTDMVTMWEIRFCGWWRPFGRQRREVAGPTGMGGRSSPSSFPGKTVQKALPHLKEVRRSVEESSFTLRSWRRPRKKPVDPGAWRGAGKQEPKLLSVTVSIGVADSTTKGSSPEAVLKKADRALYRAKESGRNQVAK